MTAAHFAIPRPRGFAPGPTRQNHLPATPIYEALVDEFRLALRTVPGDQGVEERPLTSVFAHHYDFSVATRQNAMKFGQPGSRHRGMPEHGAQQS